jgi:signal transduction histidine kinase
LLKRLLDDAHAAGGAPETRLELRPVVLQEALDAAVRGLHEEGERRGLALELIAPPEPVTLHADPERLQQMLLNLLGNAMKYTPAGGHITVTATVESDMVLIRFDDDGVGIAPENVDRIFELFTREARADAPAATGLGIGLAVVKRLASLHGGFIEARSAGPGKGAQFFLQLPIRPP